MSTRQVSDSNDPVIENITQLVEPMAGGEKPKDRWRIGTEHEKFVYCTNDHHAPSYDEPGGIKDLLLAMREFGWQPVEEGGKVIAMSGSDGAISLEPAGQLELSGAPLENLHETCNETGRHLQQVKAIGQKTGKGFLGMGMWPDKTRAELPIMPKGRYKIMLNHMPRVGNLGLDMMLRTCTIQVNLDYASEADMAQKFRVGLALQPLATALFANSPFTEGKPNGYQSFRSHIWSDGLSFRDFLKGNLSVLPGEKPTMSDWTDHLSTAFPEVRLKSFLEMRGADGGPWNRICALPAFWVGLLYDQTALDGAWDRVKHWTMEEREALRNAVPEHGLDTPLPRGGKLNDLAKEILDISSAGLTARNRLNTSGDNESGFLDPLREVVAKGKSPAAQLLDRYHGEWNGDVSKIYDEMSF